MGNYTLPSNGNGSGYFKPKELDSGPQVIRLLAKPVIGWEAWTPDNKPVRGASLAEVAEQRPATGWRKKDKKDKHGNKVTVEESPRAFVATAGVNITLGCPQVFLFHQKSITDALDGLENKRSWGDPATYNVEISRKMGANGFYDYTVTPESKDPVPDELMKAWNELNETWTGPAALLSGGDPFAPFTDEVPF